MLAVIKNWLFHHFRATWRTGLFALLCAGLLCLVLPAGNAQAHGGAIITDGYTEHNEWLVAINPFPATPGQTAITLLIYDLKTYKPVTDATAELYLAAPDSPAPCCQKGVAAGPFALTTDPIQYPGDYSTTLVLGKAGKWQAKFHVIAKTGAFDAQMSFTVQPGDGTYALNRGEISTPSPATALAFAQTVAVARHGQSPLATPALANQVTSPLPGAGANVLPAVGQSSAFSGRLAAPFGRYWWLWAMLGCGPIVAIFVWGLRPEVEEKA